MAATEAEIVAHLRAEITAMDKIDLTDFGQGGRAYLDSLLRWILVQRIPSEGLA